MREAFGGTFTIKLMLIFLAIYIAFIAVALNYAKAFRVKNKIIDIIEQSEGISNYTDTGDDSVIGRINSYLQSVSYHVGTVKNPDATYCNDKLGYCIEESTKVNNSLYYTVTTYIRIEFPFFGLDFSVPIKGETRKIERINS